MFETVDEFVDYLLEWKLAIERAARDNLGLMAVMCI